MPSLLLVERDLMTRGRFDLEFVQAFLCRLVEREPPAHARVRGACQVWTGATSRDGHGRVQYQAEDHYVHRVAFEIAHGRPPRGLLRHRCDNPPCANVDHLVEGDPALNYRDMATRGRAVDPPHPCAEDHPSAKLTDAQVAQVLRRLEAGETQTEIARSLGVSQPLVSQLARDGGRSCRRR